MDDKDPFYSTSNGYTKLSDKCVFYSTSNGYKKGFYSTSNGYKNKEERYSRLSDTRY